MTKMIIVIISADIVIRIIHCDVQIIASMNILWHILYIKNDNNIAIVEL